MKRACQDVAHRECVLPVLPVYCTVNTRQSQTLVSVVSTARHDRFTGVFRNTVSQLHGRLALPARPAGCVDLKHSNSNSKQGHTKHTHLNSYSYLSVVTKLLLSPSTNLCLAPCHAAAVVVHATMTTTFPTQLHCQQQYSCTASSSSTELYSQTVLTQCC